MTDTPLGQALTVLQKINSPDDSDGPLATIELEIPRDATTDDQLKDIKEIDLAYSNNALKLLYAYVPQVKSITSLCRLVDSTMNVIEKRRKQLCMPYGFESKSPSAQFLDPDD